ncbi:hypothetical protein [Mucilaginibacter sp.]|uniref:hypothetical protein n=1 Tax=Mucilaginibacter sp. TaxID=1882438 RepID=UPI0026185068|nr:hypothetical protein [Mucilaginibacter sp.]
MVRELITPVNNKYILNLPDEMIGKTVEVIAFEVDSKEDVLKVKPTQNIQDIKERYSRYPIISHDNYQFNRDEANDYE